MVGIHNRNDNLGGNIDEAGTGWIVNFFVSLYESFAKKPSGKSGAGSLGGDFPAGSYKTCFR